MAKCDYCGEENKYLYVCPDCEEKFCKKHKNPVDHECNKVYSVKTPKETVTITVDNKVELTHIPQETIFIMDNGKAESDARTDRLFENKEKSLSIMDSIKKFLKKSVYNSKNYKNYSWIIGGFLVGIIISNILFAYFNPLKSDYDLIEENYLTIKSNYTSILEKNFALQKSINGLQEQLNVYEYNITAIKTENNYLKNIIDEKIIELNELYNDYINLVNKYNLTSENTNSSIKYWYWFDIISQKIDDQVTPSMIELSSWLNNENNLFTENEYYNSTHSALILSLKARTKNWLIGIIKVEANFTDQVRIYNVIYSTDGLAYIDPRSNIVYSSDNDELIKTSEMWKIEGNSYVITKVTILLDPKVG